jgi:hypothetical protein
MEYSLERALGDNFTRFWGLTNHGQCGKGKDMQLAGIIHRHTCVADLCYHSNMASSLRQGKNTVDETVLEVAERTTTVLLTGKNELRTKWEYRVLSTKALWLDASYVKKFVRMNLT